MRDRRADFVEFQGRYLDAVFSLTDGEEAARARFELLAADTYDALKSSGVTLWVGAYSTQ